ncbi:hypothetical protein [Paenibacillus lactis]|uniref:hypothetical protein n=1 Tax=Paenibacillus lactis TaxID=228574 RepID=UPI0004B9CAB4
MMPHDNGRELPDQLHVMDSRLICSEVMACSSPLPLLRTNQQLSDSKHPYDAGVLFCAFVRKFYSV